MRGVKISIASKGFSLLEVMVALAILASVLVVVVAAQSQSIVLTEKSRDISLGTDAARTKMAELDVKFRGKGFGEIPEKDSGKFEGDAFKDFRWSYELKKFAIPTNGSENVQNNPGEQQNQVGAGMIAQAMEKSLRRLDLKVVWGKEEKGQFIEISTFLIDSKNLPALGAAGPGGGG